MSYQNSCVSKYRDKALFKSFEIMNNRDISWSNYEMCFRFEELHSGNIEPTLLIEEPGFVGELLRVMISRQKIIPFKGAMKLICKNSVKLSKVL